MPLFSKNVVHFGFFTNELECERDKQGFSNIVIVLNTISVLIFLHKMSGRRVSKNSIHLVYFNYKFCKGNR